MGFGVWCTIRPHDVAVTLSQNLVCDLLSPLTSINDIINDVTTREVGEGKLYSRSRLCLRFIAKVLANLRKH